MTRALAGSPEHIAKIKAGMALNSPWNADRDAVLSQLWAEGHSTVEIGCRMNLSKDAIIGRAHRLDLPRRPSPIKQAKQPAEPKPRGPRRAMKTTLQPANRTQPVTTAEVVALHASPFISSFNPPSPPQRSACKWPMWGDHERPTHRYCGDPAQSAYCAAHHAIAYRAFKPLGIEA